MIIPINTSVIRRYSGLMNGIKRLMLLRCNIREEMYDKTANRNQYSPMSIFFMITPA